MKNYKIKKKKEKKKQLYQKRQKGVDFCQVFPSMNPESATSFKLLGVLERVNCSG